MTEPRAGLERLERRATSDVIANELRRRVMDGTLSPGTQLGEVAIAESLGVSRGPVREALQRLIQEGLVVAERYRGVFVATLGDDDVVDIYLARATVERAAAAEIVRRADEGAIQRLDKLVSRMKAAARRRTSWRKVAELDLQFHETLVEAAGSRRLVRMYETLVAETRMCLMALEADYPDWEDVVGEHERLLDALRRADTDEVVTAVDEHLRRATARRHPELDPAT